MVLRSGKIFVIAFVLDIMQFDHMLQTFLIAARKFYIRRNNKKADSIETGRIVIGHLRP